MPKKQGAGGKPQEYDPSTGRFGNGSTYSKEDRLDFYTRKWDDDYGPIIRPSNRLSKMEYRLYCQTVDNNQYGSIEVISRNKRRVTIYPDNGSVVVIEDNNNNDRLIPIRVKRFRTVDEKNNYYRNKENRDD